MENNKSIYQLEYSFVDLVTKKDDLPKHAQDLLPVDINTGYFTWIPRTSFRLYFKGWRLNEEIYPEETFKRIKFFDGGDFVVCIFEKV
jgi:hypothetical protein